MELSNKLVDLQEKLEKALQDYHELVEVYQASDLAQENESLKQTVTLLKEELSGLQRDLSAISQEKEELQTALYNQMLNERFSILESSRRKLETYFPHESGHYQDKLSAIEEKTKIRLSELIRTAEEDLIQDSTLFTTRIEELEKEVEEVLRRQEEAYKRRKDDLSSALMEEYDTLSQKELSPAVIEKRIRQTQWEMKIGLNLINKAGIFLILLGVGAAFKYSFDHWMSNHLKAISFFLVGIIFLLGGEWFYRQRKKIFATGLLGGGVAILYASVFYSYFLLNQIISLRTGFFLSILITSAAVLLSIRYDSQTIGSFAVVGGFLPFLTYATAFGIAENTYALTMVYLFTLNFSLLMISFYKNWRLIRYISFILNIPSLIYLVFSIPWVTGGVFYTLITFIMYILITLSNSVIRRSPLCSADLILLGLNTVINCLLVYLLFGKAGLHSYRGLLSLVFCLVYTGLGHLLQKLRSEENARALFYGTALTFAVLTIPFQFEVEWLSLGWLIEAIFLIIYGSHKKIRKLEWAGWGVFLLCLFTFYQFELCPKVFVFREIRFFAFKYLTITLGQIAILTNYLLLDRSNFTYRYSKAGRWSGLYKLLTIINFWCYLIYTTNSLFNRFLPQNASVQYYNLLVIAGLTLALGYLISKIPLLYDKAVRIISVSMMIIADLICLSINTSRPVLIDGINGRYGEFIALFVLILFNLLVLFNVRDLIQFFVRWRSKKTIGWRWDYTPLLMGLYLLGNITAFLIVQFQLEFTGFYFNLVYFLLALGFIFYGFIKKSAYIRWLGLGLTLFTLTKLFLFDLSYLGTFNKIIAYFSFGLILLAISLLYQKIKTVLEEKDVTKNKVV